jgi:hypothetical protein
MKRKFLFSLLAAEAAICLLSAVLNTSISNKFSSVMAFPFEQIGLMLRNLSLSGTAGNVAAIILYIIISLVPCAFLFVRKKHGLRLEDGLLALLSAVLFFVLYYMINPNPISSWFATATGISITKAILGGTAYSVICAYIILRVLRLFFSGSLEKLQKYMMVFLYLFGIAFVYLIFGTEFSKLLDYFATLQAGNTGNEHLLGTSYAFLVIQFIVDSLPYALDILVVFSGITLLHELTVDRYSTAAVEAAERLSRLCGVVLTIMVLVTAVFNILQTLFIKSLFIVDISVQIPLLSIAFVLAALLLSRFIAENKKLKDDNDSII